MATSRQVVNDFRMIMRHCKKLPSFTSKESPLRAHVISKFREGKRETDKKKIANLVELSKSYAKLVSSVSELKYLRGLDTGEKLSPRDKLAATAARVGMGVPKYADQEIDFSEKLYVFNPKYRVYF